MSVVRCRSIDEETGLSYTEWEYNYVLQKGLPIYTMILDENFIKNRMSLGILKPTDLETTSPQYKSFVDKVSQRLVYYITSIDQVKSMTEASVLQIIKEYGNEMIGWVLGTIVEELESKKGQLEALRRDRTGLEVKLKNAKKENLKENNLPENLQFHELLARTYQSRDTNKIIENAIFYIRSFVEEKIQQEYIKVNRLREEKHW